VVLSPSKTYRVTVNNFLSTGGDGFTTFNNGTNRLGGAQDIDALTAYLAGFKLPEHAAYNPAAPELQKTRITRLP
jgi:5'-nucleotidase